MAWNDTSQGADLVGAWDYMTGVYKTNLPISIASLNAIAASPIY